MTGQASEQRDDAAPASGPGRRLRPLALALGPLLGLLAWFALPGSFVDHTGAVIALGRPAHATAAVAAWMATWWLTEAIDVDATALLPIVLLPVLGGLPVATVTAPFANPLIYLFLGGFVLSLSMQRWGLDRRIALTALRFAGTRPRRLVAAFMAVTAIISMWVSNTATTLVMLPIALSVVDVTGEKSDRPGLATSLMLGIAFAASIGGMGTIIGSPPNGVMVSYVAQRFGRQVTFLEWMRHGLPAVVVLLPAAWFLLTRVVARLGDQPLAAVDGVIAAEHARLGKPNRGERTTAAVFVVTALGWVFLPYLAGLHVAGSRPFAELGEAGIAIAAALALFVLPAGGGRRVMEWQDLGGLPWGVLVLFGGGLSLAAAIDTTGLGAFIGSGATSLRGLPAWVVIAAVTAVVLFLTELTSNTATAATCIPIVAAAAGPLGIHPDRLMVPVALAASCAFMLPVATPPNAIVFASGHVTMRSMIRAGLLLDLVAIVVIVALATFL